jgi:hypothetical protein
MKKINSSTINNNEIEKTKWKMKIKISYNATRVIYLVMFNKFLYQNKFVIEKKYKIYNRNRHTHKIYWWVIIKKKQCKAAHNT